MTVRTMPDVQLSPTVFSIEVSTLYHAQPSETTPNAWVVRPFGRAAIRDANGNGMGQEGNIPSYDFSLDDTELPFGAGPSMDEGESGGESGGA